MVLALAMVGLVSAASAQTATAVNVPTWRYDNTHEGQNTQETLLTPANVNAASFGKLFSLAVDGYVYAQPLYISGLTMNDGLVHNVLFVATEHDSVYAFDADSNGGSDAFPLWQASMLTTAYGAAAGATTVSSGDLGVNDIVPEVGITSTPAINLATQTLYVVSKTLENGNYVQRLHALNLITGAEQPNSPVLITGSVPGTGNGSSGGVLAFSELWQNNRIALTYNNGYVYLAFGSHGDDGPWHGWVLAYNSTTLAQTGAICTSANGAGDGIWSSGAGLPIDSGGTVGRMYLSTGNGTFSSYPPISQSTSFGDSIVQLDLANGGVTATDAFTPFNQAQLSAEDADQGSGGVLMVPDQQGSHPHILIQVGKNGTIEVVNRDNMGGYASGASANTNILQDIGGETKGLWSTPAYWNNNVYLWGNGDYLKMFSLNSGVLTGTPSSTSAVNSSFPGASPVISANGTQNGIVWAARTDAYAVNGSEVLYAWDATNLGNLLYESDTNSRDDAGSANKFVVPVVTNGKVYLGAAYQVNVYGLLNGETAAAAPVMTPGAGYNTTPINVKLTSTTANATIYYTTDGSIPTAASNVYTTPFAVSNDTVIKAIASAQGYLQSAVSSASYTFPQQTPPVTFTPAAGTYSTAQQVTLTDTDSSATIYYTTDGSTPTTSSTKFTTPIPVSASMTINAIAYDPVAPTSNVASSAYVIGGSGATINFGSGFSSVTGLTLNGSAINSDDSRLQLTSGAQQQAGSFFYNNPVNIQSFVTNFTFQLSSAQADGFTFTIQNAGPTALGQPGQDLGYGASGGVGGINQSVAVKFDFYNNAGEGTDSTGVYTDGATPTIPAIDLTNSGIQLSSGDAIQGQLSYNGTVLTLTLTDVVVNKTVSEQFTVNIPQVVGGNTAYVGFTGGTGGLSSSQKILSWTFTSTSQGSPAASAPAFSPAGGSYSTPQSVMLSSTTPGASIYYTTNGTAPSTSSTLYSSGSAIPVGAGTTTINAIAVASGFSQSATSTATYVVALPVTPTPTFTPAGGSFTSPQSVFITDSGTGAVIYYTTNGSTPTTSSAVYGSTPIPAPAGTTTIKAIAVATGSSQSALAAATYVVTLPVTPTPTFTPAGGSYTSPQSVSITDSGTGAVIYYTTNGSTPTTSSAVYGSTPIPVPAGTTTIKAIAVATGSSQSALASATYVVTLPVTPTPTFTPAGGSYTSAQSVSITDSGTGAVIYYTTNGSTPTTSSSIYGSTPIPAPVGTTTIKAIAVATGSSQSALASATYVVSSSFTLSTPSNTLTLAAGTGGSEAVSVVPGTGFTGTVSFSASGFPTGVAGVFTPTSSTSGSSLAITTLSTTTPGSYPITISGVSGSTTATTTLTLMVPSPTPAPTFTPAAGTYTSAQGVTLSDTASGSVIYYTTNGTTPTTSSAVYSNAIPAPVGTTTINAIAVTGSIQSVMSSATYVVTPAAPTFTPAAGSYATAQNVTLNDSAAGTVIYYTTNGTTPTTSSAIYGGAIPVTPGTTTINAIAVAGTAQSAMSTATFVVAPTAPVFTPAAGSYTAAQNVMITDSTAGTVIYYTTNGTTPTTSSAVYGGAIPVGAGTTKVEALAALSSTNVSSVSTASYVVTLPVTATPTFSTAGGSYTSPQSIMLADATAGAVIYYTTNGATPTTSSAVYGGAIPVGAGKTTIEAIALASGDSQSKTATATYTVTLPVTATPAFSTAGGSYTSPQSIMLTDATAGAVIYYTTNGTTPTTSSAVYGGPIPVGAGKTTIEAIALAPGDSQSKTATATYTVTLPVTATPAFTPAPGTYTSAPSVILTDATNGATIYYTTNGTTPTTSSTPYSGAIPVKATETIEAIAVAGGYQASAVTSGLYTIQAPATLNYPNGFTSANGLSLNGTAKVVSASNALQLTSSAVGNAAGSAWFATPVNIGLFTTDFTFQITSPVADGITFTIQNQGPTALGPNGGGLGYGGGTGNIGNSVALKFDIYNNAGEGADSTGVYVDGASPTTPATDLTSTGIVLTSGHIFDEHIVYNGSTANCTLTDTVTGASYTATYSAPLTSIVGASTAYVGFTGATGGSTMTANILSWTFSNTVAQTAKEPALTPAPATFKKATVVTLQPESAKSVIHYTVDGAPPTASSPVYKSPIIVLGRSLTIKAYTVTPGKKDSPVVTGTYRIQ